MTAAAPNRVKEALRAGRPSIGSWITLGHTSIAEIMAQAGFEWLVIDLEHSTVGIDGVLPLLQVIELSDSVPIVCMCGHDPRLIHRVMDAGAAGVIVPMVSRAAQARAIVDAVKYPPEGSRSVGFGRAQGYGPGFHAHFNGCNDRPLVIAQVEHRSAVEDIEGIVAVPGLDALLVSPYDLSASYGHAGQFDHPDIRAAQARVLAVAAAAGIPAGLHLVHPDPAELARFVARGFRLAAYGVDSLFLGDPVGAAARDAARLGAAPGPRG